MLKTTLRTTALLATLLLPAAASAQIYDNGPPDGSSGNEMTQWIQAEDFTLGQAYNVTGIRFWAFQLTPSAYQGSIAWRIYGNNAGAPDETSILFGGLAAATPTNEGALAYGGNDRLRFDIATNFTLGAGTYWLGLHNGDYSVDGRLDFYWETTGLNLQQTGQEDNSPFDDAGWSDNGQEHAFQLFGQTTNVVPEPSTYAMMALGLVGMAAARRRRKA